MKPMVIEAASRDARPPFMEISIRAESCAFWRGVIGLSCNPEFQQIALMRRQL
jgi:hypothetical protein